MLKCLLASAVLVLFVSHANAQFFTGKKVAQLMREDDKAELGDLRPDYLKVGFYQGFVAGAFDAYASAGLRCGIDQVTLGQAGAVVSRYFKGHPTDGASHRLPLTGS
jgi:hypothetical protein